MSVDTYVKGRDTSGYTELERDGVRVLVAPRLARLADGLRVETRGLGPLRRLDVTVEHVHGPACAH